VRTRSQGIVAKYKYGNYLSDRGQNSWFKTGNRGYSQMAGRVELFERDRHAANASLALVRRGVCSLRGAGFQELAIFGDSFLRRRLRSIFELGEVRCVGCRYSVRNVL
jgi:hypothetical protein